MFWRRDGKVPSSVALLAMLEDYCRAWDDPRAFPKREWDPTYWRDGWRCMAPGCTGRRRIEDHHIVYRSDQGSDELENQICCVEGIIKRANMGDWRDAEAWRLSM